MSDGLNDRDRWLAAEYAAGVLDGADARDAEARFASDMAFRKAVEEWQDQLAPILDEVEPVVPSRDVWKVIEARSFGAPELEKPSLWSNVRFWRGLTFIGGGLAAAAIAVSVYLPERAGETPPLVATLTATGEVPAFLARFDPQTGALVIRAGFTDAQETRTAELWLIPSDGVPRSLGLLSRDGVGALQTSPELRGLILEGGTLAISLEPAGGSPTGAPTGPVVASGKLQLL